MHGTIPHSSQTIGRRGEGIREMGLLWVMASLTSILLIKIGSREGTPRGESPDRLSGRLFLAGPTATLTSDRLLLVAAQAKSAAADGSAVIGGEGAIVLHSQEVVLVIAVVRFVAGRATDDI